MGRRGPTSSPSSRTWQGAGEEDQLVTHVNSDPGPRSAMEDCGSWGTSVHGRPFED
jgi:hypothetical protein